MIGHDDKRMQSQIARIAEMKERGDKIGTLRVGQDMVVLRALGQEVKTERFREAPFAQGAGMRRMGLHIHNLAAG